MQVVGRDQENQEFTLEFDRDRCVWELTKAEKELHKKKIDPESKETAKDKVKRLLLKDALNGNFPE